uniref:DUF87 domain-containing protein n=1 Tax=Panagrellus redivivus TaxID=6233 RepID=A0A7E4W8V9_PANRE
MSKLLKTERKQRYILLLGQSGHGKTTTINSFAQILTYSSLNTALDSAEPIILVPLQYTEYFEDDSNVKISYMGSNIADAGNERTQAQTDKAIL